MIEGEPPVIRSAILLSIPDLIALKDLFIRMTAGMKFIPIDASVGDAERR
jgi:hypothetical protein